jgi:acyl carrier protein
MTKAQQVADPIFEKVAKIIENQLGVDLPEVTPQADFHDDLGADSLDVIELVMEFEEMFNIQIPDDDAMEIKTVQQAVDYIKSHSRKVKQ